MKFGSDSPNGLAGLRDNSSDDDSFGCLERCAARDGWRFPIQVLHNQEMDAVLLADVIERADVGMVEAGDCSGFSLESLAQLRLVC